MSLRDLAVLARSQPGAGLSATIAGRTPLLSGEGGAYRLGQMADRLPEGSYRVQVRARRAGQTLNRAQVIFIDRTPPSLSDAHVQRSGKLLVVSGTRRAASPARLTVAAGTSTATHHVSGAAGAFRWRLPNHDGGNRVEPTVRDAAGNESRATVP